METESIKTISKEIVAANKDDFYAAYHARRYAVLLTLLKKYVGDQETRVLDIGRSKLTDLIGTIFQVTVDSLGFEADHATITGTHFQFDLNRAQGEETWRQDLSRYDIIVLADVIEHVHTSPGLVLKYLRTLMKNGAVMIIQTPNAAALNKRIKLLFGYNPYELIREDVKNPGHFREYTQKELNNYVRQAGLCVETCALHDYFDARYKGDEVGGSIQHTAPTWHSRLQHFANSIAYKIFPAKLKPGITMEIRRAD